MPTLLLADDEPVILKILQRFLAAPGRTVLCAASAEEALRLAREQAPLDVALVDKNFGDASGLQVARDLKGIQPDAEIILVTGYASLASAIEAVQIGAYDYVTKPIDDFEALGLKVANALEKVRLRREHRALTARVAESEARYRQLFASAPDAIVVFDPAGALCEANPAALAMFEREREAMLGLTVADLLAPPRPMVLAPGAWTRPGSVVRCTKASGEVFPAELRAGDLVLGGQPMRTLTLRDVAQRERLAAERREVEAQLRHAQKMDAVGRLAGGIGHELGNALAVVLSFVEELVPRTQGDVRSDLETVLGAGERAAGLVRQMMTLSRRGAASPAVLPVNAVVRDLLKILRHSLGERIQVSTDLAGDAWPAFIDGAQLGQALLNLAVNARDAMPDGGRVLIRTENLVFEERQAGLLDGAPGPYVAISVTDTGTGMTPEVREHIFEPFFTTKEQGKGTGLGLAVTYGIVRQAGGTIRVESEPGAGSTFRILLPRVAQAQAAAFSGQPAGAPAGTAPAGAGRTALVVDDEDGVREAAARALADDGFRVLQGRNGDEALATARAHGARLDLLLTDVVMPGMSGPALAAAVCSGHPECKVLLMTGFPSDPQVVEVMRNGGAVLEKPFRRSSLIDRVRHILPPPAPAA